MFVIRLHVVIGTCSCVDLLRHQSTDTIAALLLSPIGASYTRMALHLDPITASQSLFDYFAGHIKNRLIITNKNYELLNLCCIQSNDGYEIDWTRSMGDMFDREMDVRVFYAFDSAESHFFPMLHIAQQTEPKQIKERSVITCDKEVMTDTIEFMDVDVQKASVATNTEINVSHVAVETVRVDVCSVGTNPHIELSLATTETENKLMEEETLEEITQSHNKNAADNSDFSMHDEILLNADMVEEQINDISDVDDSILNEKNDDVVENQDAFKPVSFRHVSASSDEEDFELPVDIRVPPVVEKQEESDQGDVVSDFDHADLSGDALPSQVESESNHVSENEPEVIENIVEAQKDGATEEEINAPEELHDDDLNDGSSAEESPENESSKESSDDDRHEDKQENELDEPLTTPSARRNSVSETLEVSPAPQFLSQKSKSLSQLPTPRPSPIDELKKQSKRNDMSPIPLVPLLPITSKPKQDVALPKLKELRVHASQFGKSERKKKVIEAPVFTEEASESSSDSSSSDSSSEEIETKKVKENHRESVTKRKRKTKKSKSKRKKYSGIAELALQQE